MDFISGYVNRTKLVIHHTKIDEDLTDFPVVVLLTTSNHEFSKGNTDGFDTRFTTSDGVTLLKFEREYHDSTNNVAKYWVKLPFISSGVNTDFYFYFRTIDSDDGAEPTSVWSDNFIGVYHMSQDPSGSAPQLLDSTQNGYNCTSYGTMTSDDLEELDFSKAIDFDGTDDYFLNNSLMFPTNLTVSAKFYLSALGTNRCIVHQGDHNVNLHQGTSLSISSSNNLFFTWLNAGSWRSVVSSTTVGVGINVVHASFNSTSLEVIFNINGVEETTSASHTLVNSAYPFKIGARRGASYEYYFIGDIDDVSVSSVARTNGWLKASYKSQQYDLITYELDIATTENTWLNGWGNRALLEIICLADTEQLYYQVRLEVNYRTGMQPDFDDIRFTLNDGLTLLSYYKDTYVSATSAVFWIKVPQIYINHKITLVFMYWYNDFISTTSSAENTFVSVISGSLCFWDFDETSGTVVYDKLSSNVNGTLYGGALRVVESGNDRSVYFDGVNDYMSWTYTKPVNNFSISFWAKAINTHQIDTESATGTAGTSGQFYVVGTNLEGVDAGIGVSLGTNGVSVYGHGTSYMAPLAVVSASMGTGWNYIVITVTNKQPRIYINKTLARTGLTCTKTNFYGPTRLGGDASYGYFRGYVNDVWISNGVLTTNQIIDLYDRGACYYTPSYQGVLIRKYVDPEPVIENVAYTTGNMCVKDPYVFSCSVSGVDIYDAGSLSLIGSVVVDKLSSVWANENYLFAGTSNSGIYKFDLTTILTSPVAEVYKQYPNLTSDNVRYLNGKGNYLCSATLSGVDRYNLETDNRKYISVLGPNKCFQVATGDFYCDTYTDLIAIYNDNTYFIYTNDEGNVLYPSNIHYTDNMIHDLFVTSGTSSYNNANTIFMATTHGVIGIEEKRGDEENALRRYYVSKYDIYAGEGQEVTPEAAYKGYVMGDTTTIDSLNFINEASSVVSNTLSSVQSAAAGVNSAIKGYVMGGVPMAFVGKRITAFVFGTELSNVTFATLAQNRYRSTGVNSDIKGYVMSGLDLSYFSTIESLLFSIEESTVLVATLDVACYHGVGVSSSLKGYCMGGYSAGGALASIEALVFSSETSTIITATLSVGMYAGSGVNSELKGYFVGGITSTYKNTIHAVVFSNEACSLLSATLNTNNSTSAGINSLTKGYRLGGYTGVIIVNTIEELVFNTEVTNVLSATISSARQDDVGVQGGSL